MCCGRSSLAAAIFVKKSVTTTVSRTLQMSGELRRLSIFFALLALDAIACVRQGVESLERYLLSAIVALAELLGRAVQPAKSFVDVPEKAAFLTGEEERLLALHRVRSLIGHVERVGAQVAVSALRSRSESLVIVPQLLHC